MSLMRNLFAKKLAPASTSMQLDNALANQRFLKVGDDLELVGLLDPRTNENTTFYSSENKEIKPGDVVAIPHSGKDVVDADLYRITAIVGAYYGAHTEGDNFRMKVLYMVEEELLEDTDDYNAIHEKYLDWIGIPF